MKKDIGVFQLDNGYWAFRIVTEINGKTINIKRRKGIDGIRFKTKTQATKARQEELIRLKNTSPLPKIERKTYSEVFYEYCEKGRLDKAFGTIRKQDSLWKNHIKDLFGDRYVDEVSVAEINDYLSTLYYTDGYAYSYVESFLKVFYLILAETICQQMFMQNYALTKAQKLKCQSRDLMKTMM